MKALCNVHNEKYIGNRNGKFFVKLKNAHNARRNVILGINWKIEKGTKLVNNETICELPVLVVVLQTCCNNATKRYNKNTQGPKAL